MERTTRLRQLMNAPGPIIAPGIYDCISAKVVDRAGFDAAFCQRSSKLPHSRRNHPSLLHHSLACLFNQSNDAVQFKTAREQLRDFR